MRNGWQTRNLGDLCRIRTGKKDVNEGNPDGKFPFFTCAAEHTFSDSYSFDTEALLIAGNGDVGKVSYYKGKFEAYQRTYVLSDFAEVSPRFLYLILDGKLKDTVSKQKLGNTMPYIKVGMLTDFQLPVPPLPEQQRIVGVLDEAFEGVATAKANAKKNLQNARALFESHLQSVFTQRGNGWVDTALSDVCGFVRGPFGGSLKKSIFVADGYAVYEQQHAIYDQFDDVRYFIDEAKFKEMKRFELLPNDLIMSCSGTMGRVAIVPKGIKRGIINQALLKLTPTGKILNAFLKSWMGSEAFQDALKEYSGGAAIQNVASVKILKEIRVPLPSVKEQKRVVDELDALREETQRLESIYERKLAALEALKESLLNQAFSGQL
jgi:type I restriction enzyme S subunit